MALDKVALAAAIKTRMLDEQDAVLSGLGLSPSRPAVRIQMAEATAKAIAEEIVDHIKANAEVKTQVSTATTSTVTDVQPGMGTAPATGTGSQTDAPGTII